MESDIAAPGAPGAVRTTSVIIFDGDDTLWETESLYDEARHDAARIVAGAGFDPVAFEALQTSIDARNVETMGLSPDRFPTSSVEAFEDMARRAGVSPDPEVMAGVHRAAAAVFDKQAPILPSVCPVLDGLRGSFRLALLTKGDAEVQRRRIAASHLSGYFERIEIVPDKDPLAFRRILDQMGASPSESWSIGNSLPSDAAPALAAGMHAVWIDAHVWAHERRPHGLDIDDPRLAVAAEISEVPAIVGAARGAVPRSAVPEVAP